MPTPIKPIPGAKVFTPPKPFTQLREKPIIPVKSIPITKSPIDKTTYTGNKTMRGGLVVTHTGKVIDNSADSYQILPYVASCLTCGWQARVASKDEAVSLIQSHVGNFNED